MEFVDNAPMKAALLTGIRKIEIRDVPLPRLVERDDVLIRVDTVGVCGSDLHYYRNGRIGVQVVQFPWIVGHECAGVVAEVGPGVTRVKVGDRVAVDPLVACGQCDQCLAGREHTCRGQKFLGCPGQLNGAMAEYLVMPDRCCLVMPAGMTFDQGVVCEPFAIGLWAVKLAAPVAGRKVAVLGTGPIGLCVIAALKAAGVGEVYATDLLDERVALAKRMGADWAANASRQDAAAAIVAARPKGLDIVFECAGRQETLDQAMQLLTPGGVAVIVGIPEGDRLSFDMNHARRKELTLRNVRRQNECAADAIRLVASGAVNLDPLVTHHFTLDQSQAAFDLVADYRDGVVKAMIGV